MYPDLYVADVDGTQEVNPDCQWVIDEQPQPFVLWDGRTVEIKDGQPVNTEDAAVLEVLKDGSQYADGFYELLGPDVKGNPHHLDQHILKPHVGPEAARAEFEEEINAQSLAEWFEINRQHFGLLWADEDGRTARAVRSDFQ